MRYSQKAKQAMKYGQSDVSDAERGEMLKFIADALTHDENGTFQPIEQLAPLMELVEIVFTMSQNYMNAKLLHSKKLSPTATNEGCDVGPELREYFRDVWVRRQGTATVVNEDTNDVSPEFLELLAKLGSNKTEFEM